MQKPLYKTIRHDIRAAIHNGQWKPGNKIPTEAQLMAQYECSRMTVSKALTQLADEGLILRRARAGSFVAEPPAPEPDPAEMVAIGLEQARAMAHPLRRQMIAELRSGEFSPNEIARRLEVPTTRIYHHIKALLKADLIQQTREVQKRGATERFFTAKLEALHTTDLTNQDNEDLLLGALRAGCHEVSSRLDVSRITQADDDVYLSVSTRVFADDEALRELTKTIVTWVKRHWPPVPDCEPTNLTLATFPLKSAKEAPPATGEEELGEND